MKIEHQTLIWQKSNGPISDLLDFFVTNEDSYLSIREEEILYEYGNILIISANPGMGKSTFLDHLIQNSTIEHFFLKITLNDLHKY